MIMTISIDDPTTRNEQPAACARVAEHDTAQLTEADLERVAAAGAKPGVSSGIGDYTPPHRPK